MAVAVASSSADCIQLTDSCLLFLECKSEPILPYMVIASDKALFLKPKSISDVFFFLFLHNIIRCGPGVVILIRSASPRHIKYP